MNAVARMLAEISAPPPTEPVPDDAPRVTVTLANGSEITGAILPGEIGPICIVVRGIRIWIDRQSIATVTTGVTADDGIVPRHLRVRRG